MNLNKHQMNKGEKLVEETVFLADPTRLMIAAAVCILEEWNYYFK